jgi:hypothetical protein
MFRMPSHIEAAEGKLEGADLVESANLLYRLEDLTKDDGDVVGKKCANLGEMKRAEFPVPPGFAISLRAYESFFAATGLASELESYFSAFDADPSDPKEIPRFNEASRFVQDLIGARPLPPDIEEIVRDVSEADDRFKYQVSGPNSVHVIEKMCGQSVRHITFMHVGEIDVGGRRVWALRQGMAGELGFELQGLRWYAAEIYDAILRAGKDLGIRRLGGRAGFINHLEACFPTRIPTTWRPSTTTT